MALNVSDLETLETYLDGVMNRSQHHAETVGAIALALIGAVLWKKDDDKPIKVRTRSGSTANVLWVQIAGKVYALVYNHKKARIELHERVQNGRVVGRFTNATPVTEVRRIFERLKPSNR